MQHIDLNGSTIISNRVVQVKVEGRRCSRERCPKSQREGSSLKSWYVCVCCISFWGCCTIALRFSSSLPFSFLSSCIWCNPSQRGLNHPCRRRDVILHLHDLVHTLTVLKIHCREKPNMSTAQTNSGTNQSQVLYVLQELITHQNCFQWRWKEKDYPACCATHLQDQAAGAKFRIQATILQQQMKEDLLKGIWRIWESWQSLPEIWCILFRVQEFKEKDQWCGVQQKIIMWI